MDREQARLRIEYLHAELLRHNRLYYQLNQPEISDQQYDQLDQELQELELAWPEFVTEQSPSATVGSDRNENFPSMPIQLLCSAFRTAMICRKLPLLTNACVGSWGRIR